MDRDGMDQEDYRPEEHAEGSEEQPSAEAEVEGSQRQGQGHGQVGALRAGRAWNANRRPRDNRPRNRRKI